MSAHRIALVGAGIGASLSPALHERAAHALGLDYAYDRIDITDLGAPPEEVGRLVAQARHDGYTGLNITHPCKQRVMAHLDELSPTAAILGAVNTVVLRPDGTATGHNTDGPGFALGLARGLPGASLRRVVALGAGGAGSAVAHALLGAGAGELVVVDVDPARAASLVADLSAAHGPGRARAAGTDALPGQLARADGLVHATPVGMAAHPGLPLDPALLRADLWVADVVYRPLDTALLRAARAVGSPTVDGGAMAVFQAAEALALFTGLRPDPERMLAHLAELVHAELADIAVPGA